MWIRTFEIPVADPEMLAHDPLALLERESIPFSFLHEGVDEQVR